MYRRWTIYHSKVKIADFVVTLSPKIWYGQPFTLTQSDFLINIIICIRIPVNMICCFLALFCAFLLRYNTCSPIILIGLIDSFTDYWSNINATESVERYRSMSATYWSRWHLLVCTSKYSYKYKTEIESLPENCFSCFYT